MVKKKKNLPANTEDTSPWVGKIPWRRTWLLISVFLPEESHRQKSPAGYSPRGRKRVGHYLATEQQKNMGQTQLSN